HGFESLVKNVVARAGRELVLAVRAGPGTVAVNLSLDRLSAASQKYPFGAGTKFVVIGEKHGNDDRKYNDWKPQRAQRLLDHLKRFLGALSLFRKRLYLLILHELQPLFFEHCEKNGNQSKRENPELNLPERLLQPVGVRVVSREPLPRIAQQFNVRRLRKKHSLEILERAGDRKKPEVAFRDDFGEHGIVNLRPLLY